MTTEDKDQSLSTEQLRAELDGVQGRLQRKLRDSLTQTEIAKLSLRRTRLEQVLISRAPVEAPTATSESFAMYVHATSSRSIGNWLDAIKSDMRSDSKEHYTVRNWQDRAFVMHVLHERALTEYRAWNAAQDYDALRDLARTHYDTEALGRFLDSNPAGYPRRVFLDELHRRALACDQHGTDLIGTVNGVPGVRYGSTEPRAAVNRQAVTVPDTTAYLHGFGRLTEVVRLYLDGECTREHLASRYADITGSLNLPGGDR